MTAPLTGFTSEFKDGVLLDSGVLYVGNIVYGAFQGGLKFDPGITYRNVEFDGKRSPMKLLDIKQSQMPKISGTVITLPPAATALVAGGVSQLDTGADVQATGGWTGATSSYAPQAAGALLVAGDYMSDVRAIWLRGGHTTASPKYVQVRFPSAIITKYDVTSQDGQEVAIAIEVEARLDTGWAGYTDGTGTAPYRIEYLTALTNA